MWGWKLHWKDNYHSIINWENFFPFSFCYQCASVNIKSILISYFKIINRRFWPLCSHNSFWQNTRARAVRQYQIFNTEVPCSVGNRNTELRKVLTLTATLLLPPLDKIIIINSLLCRCLCFNLNDCWWIEYVHLRIKGDARKEATKKNKWKCSV